MGLGFLVILLVGSRVRLAGHARELSEERRGLFVPVPEPASHAGDGAAEEVHVPTVGGDTGSYPPVHDARSAFAAKRYRQRVRLGFGYSCSSRLARQRLVPVTFTDQVEAGLRLLMRQAAEQQTRHAAGLVGVDKQRAARTFQRTRDRGSRR